MLFVGTEMANFVDDGGEQALGREMAVAAQSCDEARFPKFFAGGTEGFGDAVGIQKQSITARDLTFVEGTIPILERAHDGGGGLEAFERIIGAQEKRRKMAAVGVAETAGSVVIFGEEKSGKGGVGGVGAEELIDGAEKAMRLIERDGALAAKIGLEISHKQSGGDALAGDVADDHAEALAAEIEKIVIITADVACGETETGKLKRFERGKSLREETGLHLLGNFEFLSSTALGFQLFGDSAAMCFDLVSDFIEADEGEGIAVRILEPSKNTTPNGRGFGCGRGRFLGMPREHLDTMLQAAKARSDLERNATAAPVAELGKDILGDEGDLGVAADEFELVGGGFGSDQC